MQLSVERIRWGLLAGALLLLIVLVGVLSYGHYRAVRAWKQILARSGATITHETNGITWSQAVGNKQIFTLHASHVIPHGQGRYTLQDGKLVLFGANGQPADHISAAQMDYDEKQGLAHAAGEVDMEIEPPVALASGHARAANSASTSGAQVIHLRTSGLTYAKKLGVASTDQDVEIEYDGMHAHARGAEFDSDRDLVHLLADVRLDGNLRGAPATLTATKADLDRNNDQIALSAPVLQSAARTASAARAVLQVRKDGSLELIDAKGSVILREGARTITASALHAVMNERSQPKSADFTGIVQLADTNARRAMQAAAQSAKIAFDDAGFATRADLAGPVTMNMQDRSVGGAPLQRQMGAQRVILRMERTRRGARVSSVDAQGDAWARGDAVVHAADAKLNSVKVTTIAADDLRLTLANNAAGKDEPQTLNGAGHTRIEQKMPDKTVQTSLGDTLEARFAPQARGGLEIVAAEQTGNVQIRSISSRPGDPPSEALAERAALDAASNVLTLSGHPRLTRGDTTIAAESIRMMQQTGDAVAVGNVDATFTSANAKPDPAKPGPAKPGSSKPGGEVTHALGADAALHRATQTVEFHGTDAAPARMWQAASQIEAANLLLDRKHDSMQAWPHSPGGKVRAVFAPAGWGGEAAASRTSRAETGGPQNSMAHPTSQRAVTVTAARMDYSGTANEAIFTGGVFAQAQNGNIHAQRGVAFLVPQQPPPATAPKGTNPARREPTPVASSIQKIVLSGAVTLQQPGRTATGEQLLYTAATGEYVLTGTPGHPPHVADETQGSITGATLLFRSPDSTIVVAGTAPGEPGSHRVHTETTVKK